jgi:adenosylcobinamide-phosphate synthase
MTARFLALARLAAGGGGRGRYVRPARPSSSRLAGEGGGMRGRAAGLAAGMVADWWLGDPRRWHPVAGFGRLAGAAYALTLAGGVGAAAGAAGRRVRPWPAGEALLVAGVTWTALGGRSLAAAGMELGAAVRGGELERARRLAPTLVGRDPSGLDAAGLCRAAVESVAENTADAVVGPLLWGVLAGPAGVAGYRAANTLDAMVGHLSPRYRRFGWAAARLDDLLTWPAARLGAALACALAPAVGGDPRRAWRMLRRDGAAHPSPNAGRMEAAFAGALGVRLGGRNDYGGRVEQRPALGEGPPPGPDDVDRAVRLSRLVGAATAAVAVAAASVAGRASARAPRRHRPRPRSPAGPPRR